MPVADLVDMARRFTAAATMPDPVSFSLEELQCSHGIASLPPLTPSPPQGLEGEWISARSVLYLQTNLNKDQLLPCYFQHRTGCLFVPHDQARLNNSGDKWASFTFYDVVSGEIHPITNRLRWKALCQVHGTDMVVEWGPDPKASDGYRLLLWNEDAKDLVPLSPDAQKRFSSNIYQAVNPPATMGNFYYTFPNTESPGCLRITCNGSSAVFASHASGTNLIPLGRVPLIRRVQITSPRGITAHMRSMSAHLVETGANLPFQVDLYNWHGPDGVHTDGPAPSVQRAQLYFGADINIAEVRTMHMDETRLSGWSGWRTPSTAATHRRPVDSAFAKNRSVAVIDVVRRRVLSSRLPLSREEFDLFVVFEDSWTSVQDPLIVKRELRCHFVKIPES
ncbi:hypothetical protein HK405_004783, partial [Cladochytrium tenue]